MCILLEYSDNYSKQFRDLYHYTEGDPNISDYTTM